MTKENLGKFISENRKALGMTQEELAQKLFVTNKAVSKWEKGQSFPDIVLFEPLAEALGVSVSELIAGEKDENDVSVKAVLELSKSVIKKTATARRVTTQSTAEEVSFTYLTARKWCTTVRFSLVSRRK